MVKKRWRNTGVRYKFRKNAESIKKIYAKYNKAKIVKFGFQNYRIEVFE